MNSMVRKFWIILLVFSSSYTIGQDTVTMVFSNELIKDAYINIVNDEPDATRQSLIASVWTYYGEFGIGRSLIGFDFSALRSDFRVLEARLNLFYNPISGHIGHSNLGGENAGMIFRITEHWVDNQVTWANQPATTNTNAILIPAPQSDDDDFLDVDITPIIRDMIRHPETSDGFMIKLFSEDSLYRSLVFASSDHPDANLHPSIIITYVTDLPADSMYATQPDETTGKDAFVSSGEGFKTNEQSLIASVNETGQGIVLSRSFIHFDLTQYSDSSVITLAELSLYHDPYAAIEGHINGGQSNSLVVSRIVDPWDEDEINWINQPSVSQDHVVVLPSSNIPDQDYLDIEVTHMIKEMVSAGNGANGFMLRLENEQQAGYDRNVVFAASNHFLPELRPKLVIYTKSPTGVISSTVLTSGTNVSPNPVFGVLTVKETEGKIIDAYHLYDVFGNLIDKGSPNVSIFEIDLIEMKSGLYFLTTSTEGVITTKKIVKR